ncbi:MAG: hypothetical protein FD181_939 [Prolixibacteraceae bacterium]|nr:MAG: hypothetical protein FD181_939 [Prolixibacteraceae bacterium]
MNPRFLHIINSKKPVVVDFYAEWCESCKQVPSILKEVKSELRSNVKIVKVDVDKNPLIVSQFQVQSIPTVIVFKNGKPCWKGVGLHQAHEIKSALLEHING